MMYRDINDYDVRLPERDPNPPEDEGPVEYIIRKVAVTISTTVTIRGTENDVYETEKALNGQRGEDFAESLASEFEDAVWELMEDTESDAFTVSASTFDLTASKSE